MTRKAAALLPPVHSILHALHEGDRGRNEAQADSLHAWLGSVPMDLLPTYESEIRQHVRWGWHYGEPSAAGRDERRAMQRAISFLGDLPPGSLLVALASFHASGYVREASVRRLQQSGDGSEVPFLILRCNDWVKPIASVAQQALRDRLRPDYAEHFLRSYALLLQLAVARRNDLSALWHAIRALLQSAACASAVQAACGSEDRIVRRGAFEIAVEASRQDSPSGDVESLRQILLRALASRDLWLRIWAARVARQKLYGSALGSVLRAAQHDRSVPVRREVLLAWVGDHPELERSLLDPCASLRAMVRFYLRKKATLPFSAFYRQALDAALADDSQASSPDTLRRISTALDGLGETLTSEQAMPASSPHVDAVQRASTRADHEAVASMLLYDQRPRIRRCALRALVRMDSHPERTQSRSLLESALHDPSPSVFRTALTLLTTEVGGATLFRVGPELLWQCFEQRREVGTRRSLLRALEHFARWTRLSYLLRACGVEQERVAADARSACLRALHTQIYTGPSERERARIESALAALPNTAELRGLRSEVHAALWV